MEVHTHTATERKKLSHYLWEFLMLFLAVFCGFLAENIREHKIEQDREKQYIRSLTEDLKENNRVTHEQIIFQETRIAMMDSMISLLNDPGKIHGREGLLYYWARVSPRLANLPVNSRTFEQLKNSGNFRLIRKLEISNRVMAYYENVPLIRQIEELYMKEFDQYKILASRIFDPAVFTSMEKKDGQIARTGKNPPLQSYDPGMTKQLSMFAVYMNGSGRGIFRQAKELESKGELLITYLQKEYHFK